MLVNNSYNASNSSSLYSLVRNTLQKTTALFSYRPNFGAFDSSRILLGSKVILMVGFGIAVALFIRMVVKKRVDGTAISSAEANRQYRDKLSQYKVDLQKALLGINACPLLEPIKTAVNYPPQTHGLSKDEEIRQSHGLSSNDEIRPIQRLIALLEKPQSFFTTKLVESRLQLILTPDALELEWPLFCELANVLVEQLPPLDIYLNDQFVCPCATLKIFCASKDQCSPKELVQKVPCLLKGGEKMELTQAELRIMLGYKTNTFPDELDFSDFREDTILFAKYSRIYGWRNGYQYRKHPHDQFLRCYEFFKKHHPGGLRAVYHYYFYQYMDIQLRDSPTVKKIGWDRLELPTEEFKKEMEEFLSHFRKAEVIQIGQPPGPFHRLSRADFVDLMEKGPAAFTDTYTIECSDGEVRTDISALKLSLSDACRSEDWGGADSDSHRVKLKEFSKEIVQLAVEIIKTNQYHYMIPQVAHDLYRLFDFCNFPCTELQEFLLKTPPHFSRKECETLRWESFVEIINLYLEAGQQYVHVGKETYRIDWIQKHLEEIKSRGLSALAVTTTTREAAFESTRLRYRKDNFFTLHYMKEIDQASFTTLRYLAESYIVQLDATALDQILLQMQTLTTVEFGDEDLWVQPEKYWSEVNKQLETYPRAQWITLAGSEIQWNREQVTAFVMHGNIQLEDLHASEKVVFANENECFASLSGDKITKTVCLAMWKCFSNGGDWSSIDFWAWEACWNRVFNVGSFDLIRQGEGFCRPLLSSYAQSVIYEPNRPWYLRAEPISV